MADDLARVGRALMALADDIDAALAARPQRVAGGPQWKFQGRDGDGQFAGNAGVGALAKFKKMSDRMWGKLESVRERMFPRSPVARDPDRIKVGEVVPTRGHTRWAEVTQLGRQYTLNEPGAGKYTEPEDDVRRRVAANAAERMRRESGGAPPRPTKAETAPMVDSTKKTTSLDEVISAAGHTGRLATRQAQRYLDQAREQLAGGASYRDVSEFLESRAIGITDLWRGEGGVDIDGPRRLTEDEVGAAVDADSVWLFRLSGILRDLDRRGRSYESFDHDPVGALVRGYGLTPPGVVPARSARSLLAALDGHVRAMVDDEDDDELDDDELDDDVRMLLAALEQLTGRATRGHARFNPDQPRWPKGHPMGGQFRPSVLGMVSDLKKWLSGDRKSDPFKRFSDVQLRTVARERRLLGKKGDPDIAKGLKLPHNADRDTVVKALVDDMEGADLRTTDRKTGAPLDVNPKSRETMTILSSGKKAVIPPDEMDGLMHAIRELGPRPFNFSRLQVTGKGNEKMFRAHVPGQNRPRDTMPQLPTGTGPGDETKDGKHMTDFEDFLRSKGVAFEYGTMDPRELIASQSELNGVKVAKIWGFMGGGWKPGGVMIVARDGKGGWAVVDGHHRWAGAAARSISGKMDVEAMFIDMHIDDVIGHEKNPKGLVMDFASIEGLAEDREAEVKTDAKALLDMASSSAATPTPAPAKKVYDTLSGKKAAVKRPPKPKAADFISSQLDEIERAYRIGEPSTVLADEVLREAANDMVNGESHDQVAENLRQAAQTLWDDWDLGRDISVVDDPRNAPRDMTPNEIRDAVEDDYDRLTRLADVLDMIQKAQDRKPKRSRTASNLLQAIADVSRGRVQIVGVS